MLGDVTQQLRRRMKPLVSMMKRCELFVKTFFDVACCVRNHPKTPNGQRTIRL